MKACRRSAWSAPWWRRGASWSPTAPARRCSKRCGGGRGAGGPASLPGRSSLACRSSALAPGGRAVGAARCCCPAASSRRNLGVTCLARRRPTRRRLQLESLPAMVQGVWSEDNQAQLEATTQFRKLLSIGGCCSRQGAPAATPPRAATSALKTARRQLLETALCSPLRPALCSHAPC